MTFPATGFPSAVKVISKLPSPTVTLISSATAKDVGRVLIALNSRFTSASEDFTATLLSPSTAVYVA